MIWQYYYNSMWYTVVGTAANIIATIAMAYPLSRPHFILRRPINFMVVFTMFFSGGLIPTFLLMNSLGLYGTRAVMVLLPLIGTYNMVVCRTFLKTLPDDLFENARIEGAGEIRILWSIVLPLSVPIIAVLTVYYGTSHWNTFLTALIYLPKQELHPIQVLLRRVVLQNSRVVEDAIEAEVGGEIIDTYPNQIKYAVIFFAMAPMMCLYPFLQKHFVKGVMVGALKG
jgi:putative aldouronate transport system permease protein